MDSNAETLQEHNDEADRKQKIEQLAKEKENLMKKKSKKKEKQGYTFSEQGIVGFKANYSFNLLPNEAAYQLIIESQASMNILMLQSSINIDLLDSENIPAVVSFSNTDPSQDSSPFVVTLRLSESSNRIVLKIRASEGLFGSLNAFIIPNEEESKV